MAKYVRCLRQLFSNLPQIRRILPRPFLHLYWNLRRLGILALNRPLPPTISSILILNIQLHPHPQYTPPSSSSIYTSILILNIHLHPHPQYIPSSSSSKYTSSTNLILNIHLPSHPQYTPPSSSSIYTSSTILILNIHLIYHLHPQYTPNLQYTPPLHPCIHLSSPNDHAQAILLGFGAYIYSPLPPPLSLLNTKGMGRRYIASPTLPSPSQIIPIPTLSYSWYSFADDTLPITLISPPPPVGGIRNFIHPCLYIYPTTEQLILD